MIFGIMQVTKKRKGNMNQNEKIKEKSKMRSKSMSSSSGKMLIWIDKDVHKLLKFDSVRTEATIGELASVAIRSYYRSITREKKKEDKK